MRPLKTVEKSFLSTEAHGSFFPEVMLLLSTLILRETRKIDLGVWYHNKGGNSIINNVICLYEFFPLDHKILKESYDNMSHYN